MLFPGVVNWDWASCPILLLTKQSKNVTSQVFISNKNTTIATLPDCGKGWFDSQKVECITYAIYRFKCLPELHKCIVNIAWLHANVNLSGQQGH